MKILFGGAFNPPTLGHYKIIKSLLMIYPDAKITILPANNSYRKKNLVDFHHRYNMLKIMCEEFGERVNISDYEFLQKEYLGTYYTLKHFLGFYFVIGADSFADLPKWIRGTDLIKENKFIVYPRAGYDIASIISQSPILEQYRGNFHIIDDFEKINVSSTQFRGKYDCDLLDKKVFAYIKNNNLYKEVE